MKLHRHRLQQLGPTTDAAINPAHWNQTGGRSRNAARGRSRGPGRVAIHSRGRSVSAYAIIESERARTSFQRQGQGMGVAVRRGELIVGGGFVLAAAALPLLGGVHHFSLVTVSLYVLGIAVAGHVRFDVGAGFTVPTQAIFVPMLFAVPVSVVPLLVALALALGMAPQVIRGRMSPSWLLTVAGNSWFAVGPAVVPAARRRPQPRRPLGHSRAGSGSAVRVRLRGQRGARATFPRHHDQRAAAGGGDLFDRPRALLARARDRARRISGQRHGR